MSKKTKIIMIVCITIFLLIVAAIIVSILLSMGVLVVNNKTDAIGTAVNDMKNQAKQIFNRKFESYQGSQNANNVKLLISTIIIINNQESQIYKLNITYIDNQGTSVMANDSNVNFESTAKSIANRIMESNVYNVSFQYSDGIIINTIIKENNI